MLRKAIGVIALACALMMPLAACRREIPPPIVVEDRMVKIHNQSDERWSDVRVWLNDHFVAGTPVLESKGRFSVQQRDFIAAMGQRFDPSRQRPYGVLLTAKTDKGDVKLVWGKPYRQ
jgi:hypothetical protein